MYSKLFHKDVYMPESIKKVCDMQQRNMENYFFSYHFKEHLENVEDKKHDYLEDIVNKCLRTLKNNPQPIFEAECSKSFNYFKKSNWFVTKFCVRIPYDDKNDLCVAIRPQYENAIVKTYMIVTAWINSKCDTHKTLDTSKYALSF